jgi:flavin-dependent dehydrogenase
MSQNHYNVIVVGGGPAGIAAGIAAARLGARTLLIEKLGCLGGVAASGIPLINFFNRNGVQVVRGIAEELVANLRKVGGTLGHLVPKNGHIHSITFTDPEWVKLIAEEMMLQENVDLLYHSFVFGAEVEDNRLVAVRVANKAGAQRYTADCFIDASGDFCRRPL